MSINFPNSPSNGDTYTFNNTQYTWDGEKWDSSLSAIISNTFPGITVTGVSTIGGDIDVADSKKINLGSSDDLQIYHDTSNSYIDNTTGSLFIRGANGNHVKIQSPSGEDSVVADANGGVKLYYDNAKKLETVNAGVTVTGTLAATALSGDGSNLTGIGTFSRNYSDLTNKPTIPTNNNQLTNGAGFITTSFTNTNQLTNGAGFITNSVTGDFSATGSVSIGGTLTYEDVTNIDSVGLITARSGVNADNTILVNRTGSTQTAFQGTLSGVTKVNIEAGGDATFAGHIKSTATAYGFTANATSFPFTSDSTLGNGGKAFYAKHNSTGSAGNYFIYGESDSSEKFSVTTSGSITAAGNIQQGLETASNPGNLIYATGGYYTRFTDGTGTAIQVKNNTANTFVVMSDGSVTAAATVTSGTINNSTNYAYLDNGLIQINRTDNNASLYVAKNGTAAVTLSADGSATFGGGNLTISSGGWLQTVEEISSDRSAGNVFRGKLSGTTTSTITAAGSATFEGDVVVNSNSGGTPKTKLWSDGSASLATGSISLNSDGSASFKAPSSYGVQVQTVGGNEGSKFPFVGKNTSGTTTFSVDGDGKVSMAGGSFVIQSDGDISTNVACHGNIELDSTGTFSSPKVRLYATTGNATFTGDMGIGIDSPGARLHIQKQNAGGLGPEIRLTNNGGSANDVGRLSFESGTSTPTERGRLDFNIASGGISELIWASGDGSTTPDEKVRFTNNGAVWLQASTSGSGNVARGFYHGYSSPDTQGSGMTMKLLGLGGGTGPFDTGVSVNAGNAGGVALIFATRNTGATTGTDGAVYLMQFYYSGDNTPLVVHLGGDNWVTWGQTAGNNLQASWSGNSNYTFGMMMVQ